jgi:hypothetical protein
MSRLFSFVVLVVVLALGSSADAGRKHAAHATKTHAAKKSQTASGARHHKKNKRTAHKPSKTRHQRKRA